MRNFQDTFETRKGSFISVFSICMTVLLCDVLSSLFAFEIYIEKKVFGQRFSFLHDLYCSIKCVIWNKKLSFVKWFHVSILLSCIFKQFFRATGGHCSQRGVGGVQISNVESTLSVAQWVWMAPLTTGKVIYFSLIYSLS